MRFALYNIRHLVGIGYHGLNDLVPAIRQAFNADTTDDRLNEVYGASPRVNIFVLSLLGIGAGVVFGRFTHNLQINEYIHWPAVSTGLIFALLLRRYLFHPDSKRQAVKEQDFPWLMASLALPLALLVLECVISQIAAPETQTGAPADKSAPFFGELVVIVTHALGVAAAMTIAVATICFSKDWMRALVNLAVRLLMFRIMVFVTTLVILDIGVVGPIVAVLLKSMFHFQVPEWIKDLSDQLSYAGVMSVIYLAVIGATWTVCRQSFGELLQTGHVEILKTIEELAVDPKREQKRQERARKKADEKARKVARRNK